MKILLKIIFVLIVASSCGPRNRDFDPFDKDFQLHASFDISEYDTITGECGYWNLTNRNDGTYYQFFLDESEIVAKGFNVDLAVANIDTTEFMMNEDKLIEILSATPVDLNELKNKLSKLKIKEVRISYDTSRMLEIVDRSDSVYYLSVEPYLDQNRLMRRIGYYNGKPY